MRPAGLEEVEIDPENGLLANEFCPSRRRVLLPDYLLPTICFKHQTATVSDPAFTSDLQPDSDEDVP